MNMTPIDPKSVRVYDSKWSRYKIVKAIESFMSSAYRAVELTWEPGEYANAVSVAASYSKAIKRMHSNCFICVRDGRVYIYKLKEDDTDDFV